MLNADQSPKTRLSLLTSAVAIKGFMHCTINCEFITWKLIITDYFCVCFLSHHVAKNFNLG